MGVCTDFFCIYVRFYACIYRFLCLSRIQIFKKNTLSEALNIIHAIYDCAVWFLW